MSGFSGPDSSVAGKTGDVTLIENDIGGLLGSKTITATGAAVDADLSGATYIVFNQATASTIHTFSNARPGKFYYFWFQTGNTTIDRNGAGLIGGASITFTAGQAALFVGEGSGVRQVTPAVIAS